MKKLLFVLFVFVTTAAGAKNYYISATGNDANSGLTSTAAWKTIAKVNASFTSILAGDSILFKSGDTFYGALIINKSGTSSLPIVIGSYGTGAKPVISGFNTVTSWTSIGSGIYQAAVPFAKSSLNMVALNGIPQAIGRYPNVTDPNGGYLGYESFVGTTSITDNQLTSAINWTGADVVIRKKLWVLDRSKITNHSGTTITYDNSNTGYECTNNYGYFIQNDPRTLDQLGEWYFNTSNKNLQMYFGATNPTSFNIKVSGIDTLLVINTKSYITVNNIAFDGANGNSIFATNSSFIKILNCDISNAGDGGIFIQRSSDLLIDNINTNFVLSNAIQLSNAAYNNATIRNCSINNTGTLHGMGQNGGNTYKGIRAEMLSNLLIEKNTIDTTGYVALEFQGSNVTIKNNVVNHFCSVKDDAGGIYSWSSGTDAAPGPAYTNRVIRDNMVMNGIGAPEGRMSTTLFVSGIYLDGRTLNVDIINNSVFNNAKNGIHCNNPIGVNINGNTSFNNLNALSFMRWSWGSISNLNVKNNIFYPKYAYQRNLYYTNSALNEPVVTNFQTVIQSMGKIDSNYYSTSNATGFNFEYYLTTGGAYVPVSPMALEAWQSFSLFDLNSKKPALNPVDYKISGIVGSNKFANKDFSTNITGATVFGANVAGAWDNTTKVTGAGSLKVTFSLPVANKYCLVHSPIGAVSNAKKYVLRFNTVGTTSKGIVRAYIRKTTSPYNNLVAVQTKTFGLAKKGHEFLFDAPFTDAGGSFVIEIEQNSGTTYIDDVEFYEANASLLDLDSQLRFEYNATNSTKTIALGANYIAVDGTNYNGSITLQPFTSKILVKDTSTVTNPLMATVTSGSINCFGGTTTATVTAAGGVSPYTGTGTFTVTAGTYNYIVRDAAGKSDTATISISQPTSALNATATAGIISVSGGTTTVTVSATGGTAPYTGTGVFTVPAGTYNYTVTDSKGCTKLVSVTITNPSPQLNIVASNTPINCYGGNSIVTISANGGTAPYTGTGTFTVTAGTYNYTISDAAGKTATASIVVGQPLAPLRATAVAGTISIHGGSTTLTVSATGGTAPYTGTGSFTVTAGSYDYIVTDVNGCSVVASVTIEDAVNTSLNAVASNVNINCFGGSGTASVSANSGTAPYSGTGNFPVNTDQGSLKISFPNSVSGVYTLMYYTIGSISSSKNYIVRFSTLGTSNSGNLRVAFRQTFTPWSTITPKQVASYGTSKIDHEFMFQAPPSQDAASFMIEIEQSSGTTFVDNIAVFEASVGGQLIGNNLYNNSQFETDISQLFFYSNNGNQIASWDNTGKIASTYYFTVTDAAGNTAVAPVIVSQPLSALTATATAGNISISGGTTTVTVSGTGGTAPYSGTGTFTVAAGTYNYTVTDAKGCTALATVTIADAIGALKASAPNVAINCYGSTGTATVTAVGGTSPYNGTGNFNVAAGTGSLKLSFPTSVSNTYTSMYYTVGDISNTKNYVLRFSTLGTSNTGNLKVSIRQTFTPWATITSKQSASFGAGRVDHEFVFIAPPNQVGASFQIEIEQASGTTYFDNIVFYEATAGGVLQGSNKYAFGSFESNITGMFLYSPNNNHLAEWDNTGKITATNYFTVSDAVGNTSVAVVNTTQPATALKAVATAGVITVVGGTTTVTVSATGGTANYSGTGTFTVAAGTYSYTVTDAKGCKSTATVTIAPLLSRAAAPDTTVTTSVKAVTPINTVTTIKTALKITAYPNPSSTTFGLMVEGGNEEKIMVIVYSFDGKIVYQTIGQSNKLYSFGSNFISGIYVVKVVQGNSTQVLKVVKI